MTSTPAAMPEAEAPESRYPAAVWAATSEEEQAFDKVGHGDYTMAFGK